MILEAPLQRMHVVATLRKKMLQRSHVAQQPLPRALGATEAEERKSPPPESEPDEIATGTPSRGTCLSASSDTGHEWTAGGQTSPS